MYIKRIDFLLLSTKNYIWGWSIEVKGNIPTKGLNLVLSCTEGGGGGGE